MSSLEYLNSLMSSLNLDLSKSEKAAKYIDFLIQANKKLALTSINRLDSWRISHIEDTFLAYLEFQKLDVEKFIDCGSGNGLPGVLFAILSGKDFILCDTDLRKIEFLRTCIHRLGLKGQVSSRSALEFSSESEETCFVYRGLGPERILRQMQLNNKEARHFRFKSENQQEIFENSKVKSYRLSDESTRQVEIK